MLANTFTGLRAREHYKKSCRLGLGDACRELGDIDRALEIYQDKCAKNNSTACMRIVEWMCKEVDCNHPTAELKEQLIFMYDLACQAGEKTACRRLKRLNKSANRTKTPSQRRHQASRSKPKKQTRKKRQKQSRSNRRTGIGAGKVLV